jgi:uncharacterized protein YaiI (UPF0178 family)
MKIYVDNDGCPKICRELIYKLALKKKIPTIVVANSHNAMLRIPMVTFVTVASGFDAADDYIANECAGGDLVITSDVPLAARVVAKGAIALSTRGDIFDASNIAEKHALRNLSQELRSAGEIRGGPPPLNEKDKKVFADALDRIVTKLNK